MLLTRLPTNCYRSTVLLVSRAWDLSKTPMFTLDWWSFMDRVVSKESDHEICCFFINKTSANWLWCTSYGGKQTIKQVIEMMWRFIFLISPLKTDKTLEIKLAWRSLKLFSASSILSSNQNICSEGDDMIFHSINRFSYNELKFPFSCWYQSTYPRTGKPRILKPSALIEWIVCVKIIKQNSQKK